MKIRRIVHKRLSGLHGSRMYSQVKNALGVGSRVLPEAHAMEQDAGESYPCLLLWYQIREDRTHPHDLCRMGPRSLEGAGFGLLTVYYPPQIYKRCEASSIVRGLGFQRESFKTARSMYVGITYRNNECALV